MTSQLSAAPALSQDSPYLTIKPVVVVEAPPAERRVRLSMILPAGPQSQHHGRILARHRLKTIKAWSLRCAVALAVVIIVSGGVLFAQGVDRIHTVFKGSAPTAAALSLNANISRLKGEGDGRINILLMGRGGNGHEAPDLTDTIMLASIDPVNKTARLISIPRDLWVTIPGFGSMKINAAYESGKYKSLGKIDSSDANQAATQAGFKLVDQTVQSVLGVAVNYNILVDFRAFKQAVDTVDGISLVVPEQLYDPTVAWENNHNPVVAQAGLQTLSGKQALLYVRSRETSSDFARGARQRAVLVALKAKIVTAGTLSNPLKITGLMNSFSNNVQTDFSLGDASRLYSFVKDITASQTASVDFNTEPNNFVTTGSINGQSIVKPKAGLFVYGDIHAFVRAQLRDGYLQYENAKITVINGTSQAGLASTKANELKSYGYNLLGVANAPSSGYAKTSVVDLTNGKDKYTKHYLEQRYGVTAVTSVPDTAIQAKGADFIVIIGNDEATNRQS